MKLHTILKHTQESLFDALLSKYQNAIFEDNEYILVPGDIPLMLVAHLDTVHAEPPKTICSTEGGRILMSPQGIGGDDRCGVYALTRLYECDEVHHPWLLFTCNEESGGLGATAFAVDYLDNKLPKGLDNLKLIIELDRKGSNDAVYYDCANLDLEDYMLSMGWQTDFGSYTDICEIAPIMGVAAVNLSIGYYNQHTIGEYIDLDIVTANIIRVKDIILDIDNLPRFEWEEWAYTPKLTDNPLLAGWADYGDWEEDDIIPAKYRTVE
mgnify:CR=1 FL=1